MAIWRKLAFSLGDTVGVDVVTPDRIFLDLNFWKVVRSYLTSYSLAFFGASPKKFFRKQIDDSCVVDFSLHPLI